MDILKILEDSGNDLYPEDLDFFETELDVCEDFDPDYISKCKSIIYSLRRWMYGNEDVAQEETSANGSNRKKLDTGISVSISDLAPKEANPVLASLSSAEIIRMEIISLRELKSYKTEFKKYVGQKEEIDAQFVDAHYSMFRPWELNAIISLKQMPEEFLEKYFGALDHDKIARYQKFSEGFFMKHYSQMDPEVVLKHGKNEWRKKESMSKQLEVFLRLKGIRI